MLRTSLVIATSRNYDGHLWYKELLNNPLDCTVMAVWHKNVNQYHLVCTISYPGIFLIHVLPTDVPCHPKVCHFTGQLFTQKNISGRQITVNNLELRENK